MCFLGQSVIVFNIWEFNIISITVIRISFCHNRSALLGVHTKTLLSLLLKETRIERVALPVWPSRGSAIIAEAEAMLRTSSVTGPGWALKKTTTTKNSLGSPWPHCLFMSKMLLPTVRLHLLASATAHLLDVSLLHYVISTQLRWVLLFLDSLK